MTFRLLVSRDARHDLDCAATWYEDERAGLGRRFLVEYGRVADRVAESPRQFPIVHRATRRGLFRGFPFGIFFVIDDDTVAIVAVVHLHRSPESWKDRAPEPGSSTDGTPRDAGTLPP